MGWYHRSNFVRSSCKSSSGWCADVEPGWPCAGEWIRFIRRNGGMDLFTQHSSLYHVCIHVLTLHGVWVGFQREIRSQGIALESAAAVAILAVRPQWAVLRYRQIGQELDGFGYEDMLRSTRMGEANICQFTKAVCKIAGSLSKGPAFDSSCMYRLPSMVSDPRQRDLERVREANDRQQAYLNCSNKHLVSWKGSKSLVPNQTFFLHIEKILQFFLGEIWVILLRIVDMLFGEFSGSL